MGKDHVKTNIDPTEWSEGERPENFSDPNWSAAVEKGLNELGRLTFSS